MSTTEALQLARDALDEIALAGMSGSGQESEEGMRDWHARRAFQFIGIAARAKDAVTAALAATSAPAQRVYLVATGETHEGEETYTRHEVRPPLCDAEVLFATSAPSEPAAYARIENGFMLALWTPEQWARKPADADVIGVRPLYAAPQPAPAVLQPHIKSTLATRCETAIDSIEAMLGGRNGPSIQLRAWVRELSTVDGGPPSVVAQPEAPAEPVAWPATSIDGLKPIGFAWAMDVLTYVPSMQIGPRLPGVRDVPMYTGDQLQAAVNFERNSSSPPAAEVEERRELSDAEILACWSRAASIAANGKRRLAFGRAVIAKSKEKAS